MSEIFFKREVADQSNQPSMSPWAVRMSVMAALLSSGCVSQKPVQFPVNKPNPSHVQRLMADGTISHTAPIRSDQADVPPGSMVITGSVSDLKANNKAWPDVPATCVFTGVVLINDQYSKPHQILLENMCIQKREGAKNIYEGKHKWLAADSENHYKIPFHNAHLEERPGCMTGPKEGACLTFVTEEQGVPIREELSRGLQPGTFTFEYSLDAHNIRPIVE